MWFHSLLVSWASGRSRGQRRQPAFGGGKPRRSTSTRLALEQLEDRLVPSNYSAANVSQLIADINASNTAGGANSITLSAPTTSPYVLTAVNNSTNGATGLPIIAAKDSLSILGNGDTIERSTGSGTPWFRLLDVAKGGASLTLDNLTLQNGLADGGSTPYGGAIYNQGTLILNGVTVLNNLATVYGGAIFSGGYGLDLGAALTLEDGTLLEGNEAGPTFGFGGALYINEGTANISNSTFTGNRAGGRGGALYVAAGQALLTNTTVTNNIETDVGGSGGGGGLYVAGGEVTLTNCTVEANNVTGSVFDIYGGGLYVAAGIVTLTNCTVQSNTISGSGGGIYIVSGATVYLDPFTVADTINNTDSTGLNGSTANIDGTYILT